MNVMQIFLTDGVLRNCLFYTKPIFILEEFTSDLCCDSSAAKLPVEDQEGGEK